MNLGWRLFSEGEEELTESVGLVGVDAANELATAHNLGNVGVMRVGRLPLEANDVADMNNALPALAVAAGVVVATPRTIIILELAEGGRRIELNRKELRYNRA